MRCLPRRIYLAAIAGLLTVVLDFASKLWLQWFLPLEGAVYSLIPGCLQLTHRRNPGIAFSLFHSQAWAPIVFGLIAAAAVVFIARLVWRSAALPGVVAVALGLVAGGAAGNLIDRILPPHTVVDFIDCYLGAYHWPAFNIADSAICVGAGLLLLTSITHPHAFAAPPAS